MENSNHKKEPGARFSKSPPQGIEASSGHTAFAYHRRYILLKTSLIIIALIGGAFSVINFYRGVIALAVVEVVVMLICVVLIFMMRHAMFFDFVRMVFVVMACTFGIAAAAIPNTHSTIFVWNAIVPVFAFFLLGKRWGIIISIVFLPVATILFLWHHMSGPSSLPLTALSNIFICVLFIAVLTLYYEITRAETEEALKKDITARKQAEREKEKLIIELQNALTDVKTLSGLLPICASCKKIRDDKGYWNQIEGFIQKHSEAKFSHSICPECELKLYGNEDWYKK